MRTIHRICYEHFFGFILAPLFLSVSGTASGQAYPPKVATAEIESLIASKISPHPRLLIPTGGFNALIEAGTKSPQLQLLSKRIVAEAEEILNTKPVQRELNGRRLLGKSRTAVRRILILAMAYQLSGNKKFLKRTTREMLGISEFSDWNPSHYLDVAEMTFAMAIGYDWLFNDLPEKERTQIRDAILNKGVRVPLEGKFAGWTKARNNWGQVCHGGMVAGALATMEDDPKSTVLTLVRALENLPISMSAYDPKGAYPEGPGYWSYGTTYNALLIAMLESALGESFGLDQAPGFSLTGAYPALMTGPSGESFNYADGGAGRGVEPVLYWLAHHFQHPAWLHGSDAYLSQALSKKVDGSGDSDRFFALMPLWFQTQDWKNAQKSVSGDLPLHWTSESRVPISVHRSSWEDPKAVFLGVKAGSPSDNHAHMDIGSFVLDSDGVRWAIDLGAEGYNGIESRGMSLWSMKQNSDRWTIFRQMNHSHNTLVIDDALQTAAGHAEIIRFSDSLDFPHTVVDLTPVYQTQVSKAIRGFALLPSGEVMIHDQITGLKPGACVRWGMETRGKPKISGTSQMVLRQKEASLTMRIVGNAGLVWEWIDTSAPRQTWDSPNPGTGMAAFTAVAPASGDLDMIVILTPGSRKSTSLDQINQSSPLEWSAPLRSKD